MSVLVEPGDSKTMERRLGTDRQRHDWERRVTLSDGFYDALAILLMTMRLKEDVYASPVEEGTAT